jgi:hypothetical protein
MKKRIVKIAFIVLVAVLLIQIPLRHKYRLEPYPSILLPAGASVISDRGFIVFNQTKIAAIASSGKHYEVSIDELLSTVPAQYRNPIVERGFGLPSRTDQEQKPNSSNIISQGRRWLRMRLRSIVGDDEFMELEISTYRVMKPTTDLTRLPDMALVEKVDIPLLSK